MPPSSKPAGKTLPRAGSPRPQRPPPPKPRLNGAMACDTAFRIVARRYLEALKTCREATWEGDRMALHQMRVALTHLRTAILFFSPMVDDPVRDEIRDELKWLNSELGGVRDLDIAMERIQSLNKKRPEVRRAIGAWNEKRLEGHRTLGRTLRSVRYEWLIEQASGWIESGPWCTKKGKHAAAERAIPIGVYAAGKLAGWKKKLLKRSRKLRSMGARERHRLRLLNKKLAYSTDSFEDLFNDKRFAKQKIALKHLRKAQKFLGQLNDVARGQTLAAELEENGVQTPLQFLRPKRQKRLLKKASQAFRKLNKL
jgi:CHAD domain-containing protein